MKKAIMIVCSLFFLLLVGCQKSEEKGNLTPFTVGLSADYPPFEYQEHNELKGFDVELAKLLSQKLGKKVVFKNMQFSSLFPALGSGDLDVAISTITVTPEREGQFDFSPIYYKESLSIVMTKERTFSLDNFSGKKIAVQLGSTMEIWAKNHAKGGSLVVVDNNSQGIEILKAGHADAVIVDSVQAQGFVKKNAMLTHQFLSKADTGYGVAMKKGSPLKSAIQKAIQELIESGEIKKLEDQFINSLQ